MADFFAVSEDVDELSRQASRTINNSEINNSEQNDDNDQAGPGVKKSFKQSFSNLKDKLLYENPHLNSGYFDLTDSIGLSQIKNFLYFDPIEQFNQSKQSIADVRQKVSFHSHSNLSFDQSHLLYQSFKPLEDLEQSQIITQDKINADDILHIKEKIAFLQFIRSKQVAFLNQLFKSSPNPALQITRRFLTLTSQNTQFFKINQALKENAYYLLDLSYIAVNVSHVTQLAWQNLALLNLQNCGIGDDGFVNLSRTIKMYPEIRKIFLADNQIHNVQGNELNKFCQMKYLTTVNLERNYLMSEKSIKVIEQFEQNNGKIRCLSYKNKKGLKQNQKTVTHKIINNTKQKSQIWNEKSDKIQSWLQIMIDSERIQENSRIIIQQDEIQNTNTKKKDKKILRFKPKRQKFIMQDDPSIEDSDTLENYTPDELELMTKSQIEQVEALLPPYFSIKNVRFVLNEFFRYSISLTKQELIQNSIQLLKQLKNGIPDLSSQYLLTKIQYLIEQIWHKKIDIVSILNTEFKSQVDFQNKEIVNINQIKVIKYFFSEFLRQMFLVLSMKNSQNELQAIFDFLKKAIKCIFDDIWPNWLITNENPLNERNEIGKKEAINKRKQAFSKVLDGTIHLIIQLGNFSYLYQSATNKKGETQKVLL